MNASETDIHSRFLQSLAQLAPDLDSQQSRALVSPELVSPFILRLPKAVRTQGQQIVESFFELRRHPEYIRSLQAQKTELVLIDPGNFGIAMSYDFHLDEQGQLKLIEINTNASFLPMSWVLYRAHGLTSPIADFRIEELAENIRNERKLCQLPENPGSIAIVDDNPRQQKMYIEFLVYQSLFRQWGWNCEIFDRTDLTGSPGFIYNRCTDFYLTEKPSTKLRQFYLEKKATVSPQPFEYLALADKNRLIELSEKKDWLISLLGEQGAKKITNSLLETKALSETTREEVWQQRKNWFLKPKRAFGAKQSYRGESISRRRFDELVSDNILAQKYVPAPEVDISGRGEKDKKFKYDLRFYAYMGRVQIVTARLYQGQVTNMKTLGGGFTAVEFI